MAETSTETPVKTETEAVSGNDRSETAVKTDQNETYSLKVKPEYVLDDRAPSLGELPESALAGPSNDDTKGKKNKNKKKRPRDNRASNAEKVCLAILRGDSCPYGDTCKFSHDLKAYLNTREPDITTVEGGCPNFNEKGCCHFGAMCRFGSSHLIKSTGENLRKDDVQAPPPIQNVLPKEILMQLRKRKYPFKTKRAQDNNKHGEDKNSKQTEEQPFESTEDKKEETPTDMPSDTMKTEKEADKSLDVKGDAFRPSVNSHKFNATPMPTKTRKIVDFRGKVYVAPLTTVGNLPYRRVMKKFGADITCGEMAVAGNLLEGRPSEWALLKRHPDEDVFGVQIASGYADQYTRICEVIEDQMDVDFVDLNLGCPLDIICKKGAGASLMMREKRLKQSVEGITNVLSCPVTIKMRTGWDMERPIAHKLVPKIQSWELDGIGAIMIHGRSRLQRYQKEADWAYISQVARSQDDNLKKLHVIGNGDIFSYTDYEEKVALEGIESTAMLGRGALVKPWLPTEIKERRHWDISASERLDMLKDFVKFGLTHWGSDQQGVDNTRRFLLEWLSFLYRYVPVGLLERVPQQMNQRPPTFLCGRNDLETLMMSAHSYDWLKISEMLLGPVPDGFRFEPKHKAAGYK